MKKRGASKEKLTGFSVKINAAIYKNLSLFCRIKDLSLAEWIEMHAKDLPKMKIVEEKIEKAEKK